MTTRRDRAFWLVVAAGVSLLALTACSALAVRDTAFPSLLVDPWGDYSAVYLPHWKTRPEGVRPGDPLVFIDERAVDRITPHFVADDVTLAAQSSPSVSLTFQRGDERIAWTGISRRLDHFDVWWLFGVYALLGSIFLWAGALALRFATQHPAGAAFSFIALTGFVFLTTFFDYNAGRWLTPLFATGIFWLIPGLLWLAFVFPRPFNLSPLAHRLVRFTLGTLLVIGLISGICTALRIDARFLRILHNTLMAPALLVLAGSMVLRWRRAGATERREISAAMWGLIVTPSLLAVLLVSLFVARSEWLHLLLPLSGLVVPASVGWTVLRTDVFSTNAVVQPRVLWVPAALLALVVGGSAWAISGLTTPWGFVLAAAIATIVAAAVFVGLERTLFSSRGSFRPLVESLAGQLSSLESPDLIRAHVVTALEHVLPGRRIVIGGDAASSALSIPLRSGPDVVGTLHVSARDDRALLTQSDVALVEVVAVITALALHNLEVRAQLAQQRRLEHEAQRTDKRLSVDTLAAEVAHELAYPLTYFRHFLSRLQDRHQLPPTELEIGHEEVARLERMVTLVRRFQSEPPRRVQFSVRQQVVRAVALIDAELARRKQSVELTVDDVPVLGDPDLFLQLAANLLRNASQAAPEGGHVGAQLVTVDGAPALEIWDDGPGLTDEARTNLYRPMFSTRPDGSGLGLNICFRIARSLGWAMSEDRVANRTLFRVVMTGASSR